MGKRSQIRRKLARAKARGETYELPEGFVLEESGSERSTEKEERSRKPNKQMSKEDQAKLEAATTLENELKRIQEDSEIKSKERRSAKRRAEAIAAESSGCTASELLAWFGEHKAAKQEQDKDTRSDRKKGGKKQRNPYIVFVGQLSFETTREALFKHFQKELKNEHNVSEETLSVRLLTDKKTKKSRGMAFVEVTDPELLYACLKLHHTFLEGRRLNVERSAGGKGEARKNKLQKLRDEQTDHCNAVVDTMLEDFYGNHSIQEGELDDGVIALAKRHSAAVVQAALEEYVEKRGRDMDNPSAYLTFLLGKMATEGVREKEDNKNSGKAKKHQPPKGNFEHPRKKPKTFEKQGVDMSISKMDSKSSTYNDMSSIFPSYNRGRGRASSGF